MVEVNLVSFDKRFDVLAEPLRQKAERVLRFLKEKNIVLDIYLIGASRMRKLNHQYRGKDSVTDVLAVEPPKDFPQLAKRAIGEVYLNPPCVRKKNYDIDYALVHGVLHLIGFRHERKSDKIEMEKREKKILQWLTNTS
ncbi:rRNA maturation RNase YbeY [Patescibacteria group bacterium]|nr:rRNA maturation RNase YbeY [Patescibacteria group bacterium]